MYRFYCAAGGRAHRRSDYRPGTLAFPLEELLERITPDTRAVLHQQSEQSDRHRHQSQRDRDAFCERQRNAAVLIDEAYYEFSGVTALPLIDQHQNLFVSRTFSKTYGMAAMRCGCLFSQAENMAHVRKAQSPYSVNAVAAMAARIAVQDQEVRRRLCAGSADAPANCCMSAWSA